MVLVERELPIIRPIERSGLSLKTIQAKLLLVAADAVVVMAVAVLAARVVGPGDDWVAALVLFIASSLFWLARARLYTARFITRRADEIRRIVDAAILSAASVAVGAFVFSLAVNRWWVGLASVFSAVALTFERELVRRRYDRLRASGAIRRNVLMIGDNAESRQLEAMFQEDPSLGYHIADRIDPKQIDDPQELVTRALAAARATEASGVIVAATGIETRSSNRLIRDLIDAGLHVELSSTLTDIAPRRLTVRPLGRFPVVYVEPRRRHGWRAVAKRVFDFTLASIAFLFLSPFFALVALLIKQGSEGPVIFKQSRVGKDGVPFEVLKFRTMVVNAEELVNDLVEENEGAGPLFKMKDDPRVTRIGGFLRKTSFDEFPQLWNVLRGEMSLVGPRPALAVEMAEWDNDLYGRLRVRPGITGMWQVSGRSHKDGFVAVLYRYRIDCCR